MWSLDSLTKKLSEKKDELTKTMNEGIESVSKNMKDLDFNDVIEKAKEFPQKLNMDNLQDQTSSGSSTENKPFIDFGDVKKFAQSLGTSLEVLSTNQYYTRIIPRVHYVIYPPDDGNSGNDVAEVLNQAFKGSYLVINLSEKTYNKEIFEGSVFDYSFPGFSCCPLDVLFKMIKDIDNYMAADKDNNIFVHCLRSRSRSAMFLSCLVSFFRIREYRSVSSKQAEEGNDKWISEIVNNSFGSVCDLLHFEKSRFMASQHRYINFFIDILSSILHSDASQNDRTFFDYTNLGLKLKSVKIRNGTLDLMSAADRKDYGLRGCRPTLQLFDRSRILFSSSQQDRSRKKSPRIYFKKKDSPENTKESSDLVMMTESNDFEFDNIDLQLSGDILMRLRHIDSSSGKAVRMFRYVFNTSFVLKQNGKDSFKSKDSIILRVNLNDLDSPNSLYVKDSDDLKDDLFEPVSAEFQFEICDLDEKNSFWEHLRKNLNVMLFPEADGEDELLSRKSSGDKFAIDEVDPQADKRKEKSKQALKQFEEQLKLLSHKKEDSAVATPISSPKKETIPTESSFDKAEITDEDEGQASGSDENDLAELEEYFLSEDIKSGNGDIEESKESEPSS